MAKLESNIELEAAAFRRLLAHLDERKDVQNIELMNLADFCRNCLSKWYKAAGELVYGMPYAEWKEKYQQKATPEQLARFNDIEAAKIKTD